MPQLNREQMFERMTADIRNPDVGGFSVKVAGRGTGTGPQGDKLMVGGYEGRFEDFPAEPPIESADLQGFASRHSDALEKPRIYLGGWDSGDRFSLDVSEAFSPKGGTYGARIAAAERNQEAIGVIKGGEYSGDQDYPYYKGGDPQTGRDPDLFDAAWAGSRRGSRVDPVWQGIK